MNPTMTLRDLCDDVVLCAVETMSTLFNRISIGREHVMSDHSFEIRSIVDEAVALARVAVVAVAGLVDLEAASAAHRARLAYFIDAVGDELAREDDPVAA